MVDVGFIVELKLYDLAKILVKEIYKDLAIVIVDSGGKRNFVINLVVKILLLNSG